MAVTGSTAFNKAFERVMTDWGRETMVRDYIHMHTKPFEAPTPEVKKRAEEWADKLISEGKMLAYLEATAPKPCPECGRV